MKIYGRIVICLLIILGLALSSGCRLFNGDEPPEEGPTEPEGPPGITIPIPDVSPIEPDDPIIYGSGPQLLNDNNGDGDADEDAIGIVYDITSEFVGNLTNIVSFVEEEPVEENGDWVWLVEAGKDAYVEVTAQKNNGGYTWTVTDGEEYVDFGIVISTDNFEGTEGFIEIEEEDEDVTIQWAVNTLDIVVMEDFSYENNGGVDEGTFIISISYTLSEEKTDFSIHVEAEMEEEPEEVFVIVGYWTPEGDYEIDEFISPE